MHPLDDLLARAAALHDPSEGLDGVRAMREHLDRLEALHVENGLRAGWSWREGAQGLGLSKQAAHRKYAALMRERLAASVPGASAAPVTAATRLAVALGRQEAEALRRDAVGTEHVLLGITRLGAGPAAELLAAAGVTPERARAAVTALHGDREAGGAPRARPSRRHRAQRRRRGGGRHRRRAARPHAAVPRRARAGRAAGPRAR